MSREKTKDKSLEELMKMRILGMGYSNGIVDTELKIRQLKAFDKATKANEKLSKRIYALNWIIGLLTALSVAIALSLWINPNWQGINYLLGITK